MEFDDYKGLIVLFILGLGSHYGIYRLGHYLERRELTHYLVSAIEASYYDGKSDGVAEGIKLGKKQGLKTCDDILSGIDDGGNR